MENIIGRSQFLGETSTLFTDEKTASARSKVVGWLNDLAVTADNQKKCELLVKVQETIVGSCAELLDEFLEPLLSLTHDPNMEVRKQVVAFIEQICKVKVDLLPQVIGVVSMLLRDRSPQVIKRVIQACGSVYKNGLQWICGHTEVNDSIEQAWNVLSLIKAQILDLIDNENDGIRTNAIKFLEGVVVLQSYPDEDSQQKENDFSLEDMPPALKMIKRQKLEEEALNIFDILLKFHAATHISSVNLITCTGSLCTIAKLRPSLMGPVVEAFKNLNSNLPPTLTDSQVSSVRKSLRMQLMALIKNRGSFEFHGAIRNMLIELGASLSEIQRATPKMDKQEQIRRQKRILEGSTMSLNKRLRLNDEARPGMAPQQMEIDVQELDKQRQKCARINEKFLVEHLRKRELAVQLILEFLPKLPPKEPPHFLTEYTPIRDMSEEQQVAKISKALAEQMTKIRVGPGANAFSKEPPMRAVVVTPQRQAAEEAMVVTEAVDEEQLRKEEATKKLRENMERARGEQELIERMKMKAKTLKLQEITKPFPRPVKEKFMIDAVKRILNAERPCIAGGVSAKRRHLLTVIAATFPDSVRYLIFDFIMEDVRHRIDLAFAWLFEEYCLLQGFTRHSYVKSENRPNYAYNELLGQLIDGIRKNCEFRDKVVLLRRVLLEAPLLSDVALTHLIEMCFVEEYSVHSLELLKDLAVLRPPRRKKVLAILLSFCVHERPDVREKALGHLVTLYHEHRLLTDRIEEAAQLWLSYLEKELPPSAIFSKDYGRPDVEVAWKEETTKTCLTLLLTLTPYNPEVFLPKLGGIYISTSADIKRTILRSIDGAVKKIGVGNRVLLKFIEDCAKGTETLIIRIIYILTERMPHPPAPLVRRVRDLYAGKVPDVRVLIPVFAGLTKQEILNALPKILKLNHVVVKECFNRLLGIGSEFANQTIAATPTDILVALHTIDLNACDLKFVVKATSLCMAEKSVYTQEVLIGVLQQLVEIVPIPTLLMRTIIQSLTLFPRLTNFVLNLLQRLILKQVWRQKVVWEGFLKCVQRLKPQSLAVLLQLPGQQLSIALQQCPDLREPLLEYARSIEDEPMSGVTPHILDIIEGKEVDVFITDESGGFIALENIKKEVEDPDMKEFATIGMVPAVTAVPTPVPAPVVASVAALDPLQPLPPGED